MNEGPADEAVAVRPFELEAELVERIVNRIESMGGAASGAAASTPAPHGNDAGSAGAAEPSTAASDKAADPASGSLRDTVRDAVQDVVRRGEAVVGTIDPNMVPMLQAISRSVKEVRDQVSEENISKLVDVFFVAKDPTADVRADIDAENAKARVRFMERIPSFTSDQVAQLAGARAKNKSQTASRWKIDRRIFSVPWRGSERYPAFQFRDGRPLPEIAEILAALPPGMSPWETAFWFVSANPWLNGATPATALDGGALEAARHEAAKVVG
jgi:hypothetical protein